MRNFQLLNISFVPYNKTHDTVSFKSREVISTLGRGSARLWVRLFLWEVYSMIRLNLSLYVQYVQSALRSQVSK